MHVNLWPEFSRIRLIAPSTAAVHFAQCTHTTRRCYLSGCNISRGRVCVYVSSSISEAINCWAHSSNLTRCAAGFSSTHRVCLNGQLIALADSLSSNTRLWNMINYQHLFWCYGDLQYWKGDFSTSPHVHDDADLDKKYRQRRCNSTVQKASLVCINAIQCCPNGRWIAGTENVPLHQIIQISTCPAPLEHADAAFIILCDGGPCTIALPGRWLTTFELSRALNPIQVNKCGAC